MKKRTAKRIITFLLAVVMAAAMPISINAAESPAEPLSVNAKTATFNLTDNMYFAKGDDDSYGQYNITAVFKSASNTSNEVYSATVYPDFDWYRRLPLDVGGEYKIKVTFEAVYQRLNHYSHGNVKESYITPKTSYFVYEGESSGHFRIPEQTFYINKPTDDPLGFNYWINYQITVYIYSPTADVDDEAGFESFGIVSIPYSDVIKQF